ncbi:MAG: zinc ribbon domain-containing protein [Ignavibacteriaceae bacterium]|nr:zinc ribbon domain-containing protein [Ignavibacteriaceae bacterium]
MICNTCGVNNKEENKFCINCGEELVETESTSGNNCPNCGAENNEDNKFCISCGHQLSQSTEQRENFTVQNKPNSNTGKKRKSKNSFTGKQITALKESKQEKHTV